MWSLSLSLSLSLSISLPHSLSLCRPHSRSQSLSLSISLSIFLSLPPSLSLSLSLSLILSRTRSLSLGSCFGSLPCLSGPAWHGIHKWMHEWMHECVFRGVWTWINCRKSSQHDHRLLIVHSGACLYPTKEQPYKATTINPMSRPEGLKRQCEGFSAI